MEHMTLWEEELIQVLELTGLGMDMQNTTKLFMLCNVSKKERAKT
jgi:hypothetical protein